MEQDLSAIEKAIKRLNNKICCVKKELDSQEPATLSYNGETGELTFTDQFGTETVINMPLEMFLSQAVYDPDTNILTLTMSDNTTFDVDLSDLVDASFYEEITYAELRTRMDAETLMPGKKYGITDYATYYLSNGGSNVVADASELLVVTASSTMQIEPLAFSPTYPLDTIWYDPGSLIDILTYPDYKGTITRRSIDHIDYANMGYISKIDVPFDFRTIKVLKSHLDSSWLSAREYDSGTAYVIGDFVVFGTKLARCIQNNTNIGEDYNYWELVDNDVVNTYYLNDSSNSHIGYIPYAETMNPIEVFAVNTTNNYNIIIESKLNSFIPNVSFCIDSSRDINIKCESIDNIRGLNIEYCTNVDINGDLRYSNLYDVKFTKFELVNPVATYENSYNFINQVKEFKFENQLFNTFVQNHWFGSLKQYERYDNASQTFLSCEGDRGYYNNLILNQRGKVVLKGMRTETILNNTIEIGGDLILIGTIVNNNLKWKETYNVSEDLDVYGYSTGLYEGLNWCPGLINVTINTKKCYFKLLEVAFATINARNDFLYVAQDLPQQFIVNSYNFKILNPNAGALIEQNCTFNVGDFTFYISYGSSGSFSIVRSYITLSSFYFSSGGGSLVITDSIISGKEIGIDAVELLDITNSTLSNIFLIYDSGDRLIIQDSTVNGEIYIVSATGNNIFIKRCNIPNGLPWSYTLSTGGLAGTQYTKNIFYNTEGDVKAMYMVGTTPTVVDFNS